MFRNLQVNHQGVQGVFHTKTFDVIRDDESVRFETCRSFLVLT